MTGRSLSEAGNGKAGNQQIVDKRIKINGHKFRIHPLYTEYGANRRGEVILIPSSKLIKGRDHNSGYRQLNVCKPGQNFKTVLTHRFIYECYYGVIPQGMVIDHINNDKKDNRLCNLQLITKQQKCKKAAKNRNCLSMADNFKNAIKIKAMNLETDEMIYFDSMSAAGKYLNIHPTSILMCCKGVYDSSHSKKFNVRFKFKYIEKK